MIPKNGLTISPAKTSQVVSSSRFELESRLIKSCSTFELRRFKGG